MLPFSPISRLAAETRETLRRLAPAREGALAVFTETPTVSLVRVSNIVASDRDVTLNITLEPDAGIGFSNPEKRSTDIGSVWELLDVSFIEWSCAPYINWHLLSDPALYTSIQEPSRTSPPRAANPPSSISSTPWVTRPALALRLAQVARGASPTPAVKGCP